jgi:ABC-2 type transport system ATP-binding protein
MVNMDKILVVDRITKEFPGRTAVADVSFAVTKGSIHGFLGPNGAGKSTTMRMIAGLMVPTSGTITLLGESVAAEKLYHKNMIGLLPENPPLYPEMRVEAYLRFVARLHRVPNISESVDKVLEALALTGVRHRLIGNLSKGYRQRVGLAQALVFDPPFLILDEPTNGLDPQTVVELREFIKKLAAQKTILFSSHVLPEVEQLCDDITIIHQGRIRASGDLREIHRRFRQGLVLKVGLLERETLPDLSVLGKYEVTHEHVVGQERRYDVVFEDDRDCRAELGRLIFERGLHLMTIHVESPELEDIFLHATESKQ